MRLRDDDIFLTESPTQGNQLYNLEKFKAVHEMIVKSGNIHYIAIIAGEIENYPELIKYIRAHKNEFGFGIHGWLHHAYTTWSHEHTYLSLERAKKKIIDTFRVVPKIFFPPWNKTNLEVVVACKQLDLEIDSSFVSPTQALMGQTATSLCFHYWHDGEVAQLKQWLKL